MKKYRLGYDYLFTSKKSFKHENELIGALGINMIFKIYFDEKEIIFESDELTDQKFTYGKEIDQSCYLSDLIACSFTRGKGLTIERNLRLINLIKILNDDKKFDVSFEIDSYTKDIVIDEGMYEGKLITKKEFHEILNKNNLLFDNDNNRTAQNTCYFTEEI